MSKIEVCLDPINLLYMVGQFYNIEHVDENNKKEMRNYHTLELVTEIFRVHHQPLIKYLNSESIKISEKFKEGDEEFYHFFNKLKEEKPNLFL